MAFELWNFHVWEVTCAKAGEGCAFPRSNGGKRRRKGGKRSNSAEIVSPPPPLLDTPQRCQIALISNSLNQWHFKAFVYLHWKGAVVTLWKDVETSSNVSKTFLETTLEKVTKSVEHNWESSWFDVGDRHLSIEISSLIRKVREEDHLFKKKKSLPRLMNHEEGEK